MDDHGAFFAVLRQTTAVLASYLLNTSAPSLFLPFTLEFTLLCSVPKLEDPSEQEKALAGTKKQLSSSFDSFPAGSGQNILSSPVLQSRE